MGDLNGVVVVPREIVSSVLDRLVERAPTDEAYLAAVARGEFSNAWVDALITGGGLELPEPPPSRSGR